MDGQLILFQNKLLSQKGGRLEGMIGFNFFIDVTTSF